MHHINVILFHVKHLRGNHVIGEHGCDRYVSNPGLWNCEALFAHYYVRDTVPVQKRLKVLSVTITREAFRVAFRSGTSLNDTDQKAS